MTEFVKTFLAFMVALVVTNGALFWGMWFFLFRERLATKDAQIEQLKSCAAPNLVAEVEKLSKYSDNLQSRVSQQLERINALEKQKSLTPWLLKVSRTNAEASVAISAAESLAAVLREWVTELNSNPPPASAIEKAINSILRITQKLQDNALTALKETEPHWTAIEDQPQESNGQPPK